MALLLSLQQPYERPDGVGKMLIFAVNAEVLKLGVHSAYRNTCKRTAGHLPLNHGLGLNGNSQPYFYGSLNAFQVSEIEHVL
jgi:hypothetical protein